METFNQYQKSSVSAQAKSGLCGDRDDVSLQTLYENMFVMLSGTIRLSIEMMTSVKNKSTRRRDKSNLMVLQFFQSKSIFADN